MRKNVSIFLTLFLCCWSALQSPTRSFAADSPTFNSPAAVAAAAEEAFVNRDFKAYADCFDADGQKFLNTDAIQLLTVFANLTPNGHGKDCKAVLTKYGLTDLSKKGDETDDQLAVRLAGQLKDPRGFLVDSMPLTNPETYLKKPAKGELKGLVIDGTKAKAAFAIKLTAKYTMSQDLTFVQTAGSWKISSDMGFPGTAETDSQ